MTEKYKLGSVCVDNNILAKGKVGLWAVEFDEDSLPRMYVDDMLLKSFGVDEYMSSEMIYAFWYDRVEKSNWNHVKSLADKMKNGIHTEIQYHWIHPDGRKMIIRCSGCLNAEYTKGVRIEGAFRDVTDIMNYEEELIAQQRSINDFFLDTYVSVYYVNLVNHSCQIYRRTKELDKDYPDLNDFFENFAAYISKDVHPDDRKALTHFAEPNRIVEKLKQYKSINHVFRDTSYGEEKNYKLQIIAGADEEHAAFGFIDISEELKEQNRRLNEARSFNERLLQQRNLLDYFVASYSSAYSVNLLNDSFEILNMSHDFSEIFNMNGNVSDMHRFIKRYVHPKDREMMMKMIDKEYVINRLRREKSYTFTVRELYGGISRTMKCLIIKGADEYHIAIGFLDISDEIKKEKERQKKLRDALAMSQSANRAKTTFLNNMSHDIRTPMNAIIGYTELAERNIDNKEILIDYLQKIDGSSKHLLSLINDVLNMSRIESGKIKIDENKEDLFELLESVSDMIKSETDSRKQTFTLDYSKVRDKFVMCDKLRLRQVLLNILSNAVKYTDKGGKIVFEVTEIRDKRVNLANFRFKIIDNGIGMSDVFRETIFEPFSRANTSTVSGVQGTGLGMPIAQNIVKMMGGDIKVESKLGKGTTVTVNVNLRLCEEDGNIQDENVSINKEKEINVLEGKKILLVEDNPLNMEIATQILESFGICVDCAEDGICAVEKIHNAKKGDYELILMDIQMPTINGFQCTRLIREMKSDLSDIPIIAMTANAFEEDKKDALAVGMNDHLAKPIDVRKLQETLIKYLC